MDATRQGLDTSWNRTIMKENKMIGEKAGELVTMCTNSIFIGINAGADVTEGDKLVIIGDNIRDLKKPQNDVIFILDYVAIGKTILGEPNPFYETLYKLFNHGE